MAVRFAPRGIVAVSLLVGCGHSQRARPPPDVELPPADSVEPAPPSAPRAKLACALSEPESSAVPWRSLLHVAELAGRSYYFASDADGRDVLLWLGTSGEPSTQPIPGRSEQVAQESATQLRFMLDGDPPRWFTLDLTRPDAPEVSSAEPVAELRHPGTPKAFASDGTRALVGRYQIDYSVTPARYFGETALHSLPDGKRTSPEFPVTAWRAACRKGRCVAAASREGIGPPIELYGMTDTGSELLDALDGECMGFAEWQEGDHWQIARPRKSGFELHSIEIESFRWKRKLIPNGRECPSLTHVELGGRHGLLVTSKGSALEFVPVRNGQDVGAAEVLPRVAYPDVALTPMTDGALLVEQKVGGGMMHSPTDSRGIRRYYHVWSFDGRAALLSQERGRWQASAWNVLPESGKEGKLSDGFRARPLVRPGFAAVLVDGGRGKASTLFTLARPCERRAPR
ncbi:MAG: hypothetical protein U0263_06420 [Polyangiaceae bacterium]